MKRKSTALLLSLLLLLALCVPALAAIEYGVFYDETEQLGSVELSYAAEQTLPRLTQELGVDLRVDAFTDEDVDADTSAADIAAYGACMPSSMRCGAAHRSCPTLYTTR